MERLEVSDDGLVEVSGRWSGVRGRRFVRPTLTVTMGGEDGERRWLAELAHKPWAAQDGELWTAAFMLDVELGAASTIELSVAPDIEVALRSAAGETSESSVAEGARTPLAKQPDPRARRPSARAQDLERMSTRLTASEAAHERERERRATAEQALERQRAEGRRLSAELGRIHAELELAQTVHREADAMSAELESVRRDLRAVELRYEQLTQEHERAIEGHSRVETELRERSGALESARDALAQQRARGPHAPADAEPGHDPELPPERLNLTRTRPVPRTERPLNPALRSRPNWLERALALLVIVGVIVAVWLVLHSTILHS